MKRFHISISTQDFAGSLADYSERLGCKPCVTVDGRYALWRTPSLNFSISCKEGQPGGIVRHLGFEDAAAGSFSEEADVNGIVWEHFSQAVQQKEIEEKFSVVLNKTNKEPSKAFSYRLLAAEDSAIFRDLRLRAAKEEPAAFLESYEELIEETAEQYKSRFNNGWIAGAFCEGGLVGCSGLFVRKGRKVRHKGTVWGVYVTPEMRGHAIARTLTNMVLDEGKAAGLEVAVLNADSANPVALGLYESMGFMLQGMEPHDLKLPERYVDNVLMVKFLQEPVA